MSAKQTPPKTRTDHFQNVLRSVGARATPARVDILNFLQRSARPLSIQAISRHIKNTDQATVYRALESLAAIGLVRHVDLRHGHAHYELADPHDHHHVICTSCGRMEDFTGCGVDVVMKRTLKKSKEFVSIDEHSFELFGTCKKCASKKYER